MARERCTAHVTWVLLSCEARVYARCRLKTIETGDERPILWVMRGLLALGLLCFFSFLCFDTLHDDARQQLVVEHKVEILSFRTTANATRHHWTFCDFGAIYNCSDLLMVFSHFTLRLWRMDGRTGKHEPRLHSCHFFLKELSFNIVTK